VVADVVMYRTKYCGYCVLAKRLLEQKGVVVREIDVSGSDHQRAWLRDVTNRRTVPQVFIDGTPVGGYTELVKLDRCGELDSLLAGK